MDDAFVLELVEETLLYGERPVILLRLEPLDVRWQVLAALIIEESLFSPQRRPAPTAAQYVFHLPALFLQFYFHEGLAVEKHDGLA